MGRSLAFLYRRKLKGILGLARASRTVVLGGKLGIQ
jgi:hypothetical protein